MSTETINTVATFLALAGALPSALAFFTYVLGRPRTWWRSWLGWTLALLLGSILLFFALALSRRLGGEYPGYLTVTLIAYAVLVAALWLVFVMIVRQRRQGRALGFTEHPGIPSRKAAPMSNTPISAATVPSIWYKAQRVIRTILAVVMAIVTGIGSTLAILAIVAPQILAELEPLLAPEVFAWLVGAVAFIVTLSGVITRIMAIPAVNAFLTKFGAGSVPKAAIIDAGVVAVDKSAVITSLPRTDT